MRVIFLISVLLFVSANTSRGSTPDEDVTAIHDVIDKLFDAMRAGDGPLLGSLFHPDATLKTVMDDGEAVSVRHGALDRFIQAVGSPREEVWDEQIRDVVVHVDGPLGVAWMEYTFYVGERLLHCGVNAIEFAKDATGWKILGVTHTRRSDGCWTGDDAG
jgi:hypothetical protein